MNIFKLHEDPMISAEYHCDQHVVKMILEYAQMLSTAHRILDGKQAIMVSLKTGRQRKIWEHPTLNDVLYKATHENHPSNVWVRTSGQNYRWLYQCFEHLGRIFYVTSNKQHKTIEKLKAVLRKTPNNISFTGMTPLPPCMPDKYITGGVIKSYRDFYREDKSSFAAFKRNGVPDWWEN